MQCPQCKHENPEGVKFCNECGSRLEFSCASCGQVNPPGAKFCNNCGHSLAQADGAGSVSPPTFASPETYTPKYLAERILTSKASLEGERKQVTVLFADLKGSMELLADRDPEDARALLDAVLTRMMEDVSMLLCLDTSIILNTEAPFSAEDVRNPPAGNDRRNLPSCIPPVP